MSDTALGLAARRAALRAMTAVTEEGHLLDAALADAGDTLSPADRARAGRLAAGALRWSQRADRLLGPFLRNRPEDAALNPMRLALYEIHVEGAPDHAAVNAAVALAPKPKAGLVNAVLRNVARKGTDWNALPLPTLPKWLRKPLLADWGKAAVEAIEQAIVQPVPLDLSVKSDAPGWAGRLGGTCLPTGSVRLADPGQISALPGYADGDWWVQDAAAALPARLLDPRPGERVLDLCAAPGGKTMQLASAGAEVTALDVSETRMARVGENLARTGLSATLVTADALDWQPEAAFDAILVDAPCTATGTLRRHPDLAHAKDMSGLPDLVALQKSLIDRAASWLRPGGRMVICTCSLLKAEGEEQLARTLAEHKEFSAVGRLPEGADPAWAAPQGGLRTRPDHWPQLGGLDGFFMALLQKAA